MKKSVDGHFWNSRPAGPNTTEFHVGWVNYLDEGDQWRPIDCELVPLPTGFTVRDAPFFFQAPLFADQAAYFESNCRFDVFTKERITAAPLGKHLTALDAAHVPGRLFDLNGDGRLDAVLYEGAFPGWGADLIYYVKHGRAPRLEKLIRFHGPTAGDIAARFALDYTGGVEISPRRIEGARRAAHWDRSGRLAHRGGFYVRAQDEAQKRGLGIGTPPDLDSNPDVPKSAGIDATFEEIGGRLVLTKHVPGGFFTGEVVYPVYTDLTSTFYPDPDPETTSIDALVRCNATGQSFTNERNDAGDEAYTNLTTDRVEIEATTNSNQFHYMARSFALFDTSALGAGSTITSATLSLYGTEVVQTLESGHVCVVSSNPASNTDVVASDYATSHFGSTEFASRIASGSFSTSAYNDFALNGSGLANISKTGVSKFGIRFGRDIDNTAPAWSASNTFRVQWASADASGTSTDPKLVVVYTLPPAAIQATASYAVRTTPAAITKGSTYSLAPTGDIFQVQAGYAVRRPAAAITTGAAYHVWLGAAKTLRYEVALGLLSGVIKDRRGNAIDCSTYNVRINVYPVDNTTSPPVETQLVTASNGTWLIAGLDSLTKYLVTFEYQGTYVPLGDQDIADAAYMTATI